MAKNNNDNNLKEYWTEGPGAAKIAWGTPGDFTRCHEHLSHHVDSDSAARMCATWHHEQTGMWPGDRNNR